MKLLHTADIHLSSDKAERLEALEEIIKKGNDRDVSLLLVSGDMFDRNVDVEEMRTRIRPLFSDNDFETLVISGNHDKDAFRKEDYFGEDLETLDEKPFEVKEYDEMKVVGLPYTTDGFENLVDSLSEEVEPDKTNVLMIHCTLLGSSGGFGNEEKYLPVSPEQIAQAEYDYVLAGHIHSSATKKEIGDTVFAYSGSPVSISKDETGSRSVWELDTEEEGLSRIKLDTHHYQKFTLELVPGKEEERIGNILDSLDANELENATILVKATGFTKENVKKLKESITSRVEDLDPESLEADFSELMSVSSLIDSPIYEQFKGKLEERNLESPEKVEKKFLEGLSRYAR